MSESATEANRRLTAERITQCAQNFAEERGLDGFTMDDVAACAGVSRRTLFNYVSGKLDAVLGSPPDPDPADLAEFRAGGPTGNLAEDLKIAVATVLERRDLQPDDMDRMRRLVASDARLLKAIHDNFAHVADVIVEAISEREGEAFDPVQAQAAAAVTLALFDVALDAFLADPSSTLVKYYLSSFDAVAAIFN